MHGIASHTQSHAVRTSVGVAPRPLTPNGGSVAVRATPRSSAGKGIETAGPSTMERDMKYIIITMLVVQIACLIIGLTQGVRHIKDDVFSKSIPWLLPAMVLAPVIVVLATSLG